MARLWRWLHLKSLLEVSARATRGKACGLNRGFVPQAHEEIASAFALRAFLVAVVSGRLTVGTFLPIKFVGNGVYAVAALLAGLYPARVAARIRTAEAVRTE